MSNMIIFRPLPLSDLDASQGTNEAALLTADPKEIYWVQPPGSTVVIDMDLGSLQSIDSVLLGFVTNTNTPFSFDVTGGATAGTIGTTTVVSGVEPAATSSSNPPQRHMFKRAAAPVSVRWVRLTISVSSGAIYTAGILAVGLAFQPTYNREWGSGRQIIDTGAKEALLGGGFGIGEGARKTGYRWTFGDLTDAEVDALYDLALDRGETQAIVVIEDPDDTAGLNERIHYGLFDRFEAYERQSPGRTRWALSLTEWC